MQDDGFQRLRFYTNTGKYSKLLAASDQTALLEDWKRRKPEMVSAKKQEIMN